MTIDEMERRLKQDMSASFKDIKKERFTRLFTMALQSAGDIAAAQSLQQRAREKAAEAQQNAQRAIKDKAQGAVNALHAVWALDKGYKKIQEKSSEKVNVDKIIHHLVREKGWENTAREREAVKNAYHGGLDTLEGNTYADIYHKLDAMIKQRGKTVTQTLYRGVDSDEWEKWSNASGGQFVPGRFTAFSSSGKKS